MNAILRPLAALLLGTSLAAGAPPGPPRVVVLDNENLIEGQVTRVPDGYEIRRPVGGDVTLPPQRVLAVVDDRPAAFAVIARRANLRDADERLRLARWCLTNGLTQEALAEAEAAARMRPGFTAAEQLARGLRDLPKPVPRKADPAVVPARAEAPAKETVTDVASVEYNSESYPLFASKVNAILQNACANCHARDDVKAFRLTRLRGQSGVAKNLTAALAQVSPTDPAASPLLVKAVTPHGTAADAPLRSRNHPAYQALETWARYARAPEGTLAPEEPLTPAAPPEPRKLPDLGPEQPASPGAFGQDQPTGPAKPAKPVPDDPFDPAVFNEGKKKE